mgnify:FL=1
MNIESLEAMNFQDVLHRAKFEGELRPEEVEAAADALRKEEWGESDPYDLLYIVGLGGMKKHRPILERFLDSPDDPMLARAALIQLCRYFDEFDRYRDVVIQFIEGVQWDWLGAVRHQAIRLAGQHLAEHEDIELLRLLFEIYLDPNDNRRETAYKALEQAVSDDFWDEFGGVDEPGPDSERAQRLWRKLRERFEE